SWISAIIGKMALAGGMTPPHMMKLLQFVCCFYGIATLGVCYVILRKFPLSAFSSAIAFGAICFLPRHIYMSAMNSNDTISYLCVAISIYDPSVHRPRDPEPISFVSFKPWEDVVMPMLAPGKLHSFWTMLYSGMWFDTEPYFLSFLDANGDWWQHYYSWYRGEEPFPGK